jgi:hypothetical protein
MTSTVKMRVAAGLTACLAVWAGVVLLGCNPKPAAGPATAVQNSSRQGADRPQTASKEGAALASADALPNEQSAGDASPDDVLLVPPPLFDGWPQPTVALVLSGQQLGYIEPCGCSGLENQKGGLARRHTFIEHLKSERGWPVVSLDVGSQVRRYGKQAELKFAHSAQALRTMGYGAATLGADDLRLPAGELLAATNPDEKESLFLSANVALLAREFQPQFRVVEAGGKRIGVTGFLGERLQQRLQGDELVHEPPLEALRRSCRELKSQECDFYVLLAHTSLDEAREIAQELPMFDLIVAAGDTNLPSRELETIDGTRSSLMQVGTKAMYVGVVGLFDDPDQPLRYENVPLDSKLADSPAMMQMLTEYQEQLQQLGLEGLGLRPQPHPTGRKFVGSETCGDCHERAYKKWSSTPHGHATDSLVTPPNTRGDIARHHDPECLSCHATGWEPQKFYPFDSGYLSLEKTPKLLHNGCENCHGPGSQHVAAETGEESVTEEEQLRRRDAMRLLIAGGAAERKCLECHDLDNSPDFHVEGAFAKYWRQIAHPWKD